MMKQLVSTALTTILVLMLFGAGGLFLGSRMEIPGRVELKIVKSGSMEPAIPTGGLVFVKPSVRYEVGDVITFGEDTRASVPTTHRIVSVRDEYGTTLYETKGDANEDIDAGEVSEDMVIGKVVASVPYAGYILDFSRQPLGFVLLIAIPAGIIILFELLAIFEEVRRALMSRKDARRTADTRVKQQPRRPPAQAFPPVRVPAARRFDI